MSRLRLTFAFHAAALVCRAQTTQSLISGAVWDAVSGKAIAGAKIQCINNEAGAVAEATTSSSGYYSCPLLPPGNYVVRAEATGFQPKEVHRVQLQVAGRTLLHIELRKFSDTSKFDDIFFTSPAAELAFYGPDAAKERITAATTNPGSQEALESAPSAVIDGQTLRRLPFPGRDVYTMLVLQPGVTADSSSGRGVGVSVHGQRPTASNFLLDGIESNNTLITGPSTPVAPEATGEYRLSLGEFSAEYGGTLGFLANVITRPGLDQWHGTGYLYNSDERLGANDFQNNRQGFSRPRQREWQGGLQTGGRLPRKSLYLSLAHEHLGVRAHREPEGFKLPAPGFVPDGAQARELLRVFPSPATESGVNRISSVTLTPTVTIDRSSTLARLDWAGTETRNRIFMRIAAHRSAWPDFIWSPYKDFRSNLRTPLVSAAAGWIRELRPRLVNELRAGAARAQTGWDRPHLEIPTIVSGDGVTLPGSQAFYEFQDRGDSWEVNDNLMWIGGRHIAKFGATLQARQANGYLTPGRDGQYFFDNFGAFSSLNSRASLVIAVDRTAGPPRRSPDFNRHYTHRRYAFFAQDSIRVTRRLVANAGLRWEYFAPPSGNGSHSDTVVRLGAGATLAEQLKGASLSQQHGALYTADRNDAAIRTGLAYSRGELVLRGAYGMFYDRPFDNLFALRTNNYELRSFSSVVPRYDTALAVTLPTTASIARPPVKVSMIGASLRTPLVHSYSMGLQRIYGGWSLESTVLGSFSDNLIATDLINRDFSTGEERFKPDFPEISYRANQGRLNYNALALLARYKRSGGLFQAGYTWSHTIDNQSDPLSGELIDLGAANLPRLRPAARRQIAAFSKQFDSKADWGNADYDQRHSLLLYGYYDLPSRRSSGWMNRLAGNWHVAGIATFRSGFPFTVFGGATAGVRNKRADIRNPADIRIDTPIDGGRQLLNPAAFSGDTVCDRCNSGRNAFAGPGYFGVDGSLSRSFPILERARIFLRADVFNVLNHANLNSPRNDLNSPFPFGEAFYGRTGQDAGFPSLVPLRESPRRVQLMLRVEF